MKYDGELLPEHRHLTGVSAESPAGQSADVVFTRDHDVIEQWARKRRAEPATGEATNTGPATMNVNDGGAGVRFNFPGAGVYRPITWEEWFANFDRHELAFVYDNDDQSGRLSNRYRIVKASEVTELGG
ncbi:hypothetical protein BH24ACI4_BH24ACI4_14600 [soil metagenome]